MDLRNMGLDFVMPKTGPFSLLICSTWTLLSVKPPHDHLMPSASPLPVANRAKACLLGSG